MATIRSKRAKRARQDDPPPAPAFDFSEAARSEIEAAVRKVRPQVPISPREWNLLLGAGHKCRVSVAKRKAGRDLTPAQQAAAFAKAARTCRQLRDDIETAGKARGGDFGFRGAVLIEELPHELSATLAAEKQLKVSGGSKGWEVVRDGAVIRMVTFGEVLDLLAEVERALRQQSDPRYWRIPETASITGRRDPSVILFQEVLWIWTSMFRGTLKYTWNPVADRPEGPVVTFFFAFMREVMGADAPSLKSFRDIVKRQERFMEYLRLNSPTPDAIVEALRRAFAGQEMPPGSSRAPTSF
jgi:hypothetical protein